MAKQSLGSEPLSTIQVGDDVRVLASRRKKPSKTSEAKLRRPTWSESIYEVTRVSKPKQPDLSLPRYTLDGSTERWYANELLKVDRDQLVQRHDPSSRPDYSEGTLFNLERHNREMVDRSSIDATDVRPVMAFEERQEAERRAIQKPRRLIEDGRWG
jgi:hypothetical protein